MIVYFTASISGKSKYEKQYSMIVNALKKLNYQVNEHILDTLVTKTKKEKLQDKIKVYRELENLLRSAEIVIAEISYPSLSVGHEISIALELNKPVIALHQKTVKVGLLEGIINDKLQVIGYDNKDDIQKVLSDAVEKATSQADIRFNFFIPPFLLNYLDWLSKKRRIPRSVFIRDLIERELKADLDYQKETGMTEGNGKLSSDN